MLAGDPRVLVWKHRRSPHGAAGSKIQSSASRPLAAQVPRGTEGPHCGLVSQPRNTELGETCPLSARDTTPHPSRLISANTALRYSPGEAGRALHSWHNRQKHTRHSGPTAHRLSPQSTSSALHVLGQTQIFTWPFHQSLQLIGPQKLGPTLCDWACAFN